LQTLALPSIIILARSSHRWQEVRAMPVSQLDSHSCGCRQTLTPPSSQPQKYCCARDMVLQSTFGVLGELRPSGPVSSAIRLTLPPYSQCRDVYPVSPTQSHKTELAPTDAALTYAASADTLHSELQKHKRSSTSAAVPESNCKCSSCGLLVSLEVYSPTRLLCRSPSIRQPRPVLEECSLRSQGLYQSPVAS
jgi:hypothetical protein